jgi:hypothetical protein
VRWRCGCERDGTAVMWDEEGTRRDSGGDAERKQVRRVVTGREGRGNEKVVVGDGDAGAGHNGRANTPMGAVA